MKRLLLSVLALAALASCHAPAPPTRVGSKKFTESVVLGEAASQLLQSVQLPVKHERELGGTRILWSALLRGELDVYPEYTGTLREEVLSYELGPGESLPGALQKHGVEMSRPLGFEDPYALGVPEALAEKLQLRTISDLLRHPELRLGFSHEFLERKDGWAAVQRVYALPQGSPRGLDHELAYRAIANGNLDVTDLYTTDPEIERFHIRLLEDDKRVFPECQAIFLMRSDWVRRHPEGREALARLEGALDTPGMRHLNGRASLEHISEARVAQQFLDSHLHVTTQVHDVGRTARIAQRTLEHSILVGASLLPAALVAIPLGILCARRRRLAGWVLGGAGIVQTIPALALLVLLLPVLGIGEWPALASLFVYSLLPMVRNTYSGLAHLPLELRESAEALGLPPRFKLWRIELPLASPSILAGIKTAAVLNVGTATLGALIGAGGYGRPILEGIRLYDVPLILEGAIPAALMALVVQALFGLLERVVVPRGLRLET